MLIVRSLADQLAAPDSAEEDDLLLARDAGAYHLKLSESVLRQTPDHLRLAEAVAGGFTQYAYAFVAFEADKLQNTDSRAAQALNRRAARLYQRAQRHAMTALSHHQPDLVVALPDAARALPALGADEVGVAYWAAASWGAAISLSKDRPEAVADLPQVMRLAASAFQADPDHGHGALASLMGTLEVARPGGRPEQARAFFDRAEAAAGGSESAVHVARAESLAQPSGDRAAFEALLQRALQVARQHPSLGNEIMRQRAQWLLATIDERF